MTRRGRPGRAWGCTLVRRRRAGRVTRKLFRHRGVPQVLFEMDRTGAGTAALAEAEGAPEERAARARCSWPQAREDAVARAVRRCCRRRQRAQSSPLPSRRRRTIDRRPSFARSNATHATAAPRAGPSGDVTVSPPSRGGPRRWLSRTPAPSRRRRYRSSTTSRPRCTPTSVADLADGQERAVDVGLRAAAGVVAQGQRLIGHAEDGLDPDDKAGQAAPSGPARRRGWRRGPPREPTVVVDGDGERGRADLPEPAGQLARGAARRVGLARRRRSR